MRAGLEIVSVGGGPAGLMFAALAGPDHRVTVLERNAPDATFGFGVVFSERTLDGLAEAHPAVHAAIQAASVRWEHIEVRHRGRVLRCGGHGFFAIARRRLLAILQEHAAAAGAELCFGAEADPATAGGGADVVLGADGVNSRVRDAAEGVFRPDIHVGAAKYIWFATPAPFDALTFDFVEDEHGWWAVHAYPFDEQTSTFIVETDEATWRRAGLDATPALAPGESDERSRALCEELFAGCLAGAGLLVNNSRWLNFRTVRCGAWQDGRTVLLGDAAHTAHFSVGSGTKMALEDALGLATAVRAHDDLADALDAYERARRGDVAFIQRAATPSRAWWETYGRVAGRPTAQFAFHFLSRSPVVTRERLRARDARFVAAAEREFAAAHGLGRRDGPLAAPLDLGRVRLPSRLVAAPAGAADVAALGGLAAAGAGAVLSDTSDPWAVRALAEWLHARTAAAAGVRAAASWARVAVSAGADLFAPPPVALDDIAAGRALADGLGDWPADRPVLVELVPPAGEPRPADADLGWLEELVAERCVVAVAAPPLGDGRPDEDARATQLLLCDELRARLSVPVGLARPGSADEAATAILAGRADLVVGAPRIDGRAWDTGEGRAVGDGHTRAHAREGAAA